MEAGFFLLEAGAQRKKNTHHVLFINLMSACVALIFWWFTGYAFAFGYNKDEFISGDFRAFAQNKLEDYESNKYIEFIFQFVFCTTTTSIVSG
jgi:Amt family ammonium transporter